MATLYAKAAGGNWSAAGTWSNVSSAGGDSSGPPTAADDTIFDAGSGNVTIDAASVCRSIDASTYPAGKTLTHNAFTLSIGDGTAGAGNKALDFGGGFTYTLANAITSEIDFISTSATVQTVNFNSKTTGYVKYNATSNGSWQLTGTHNTGSTATVELTKGTLDTNGQTCSWGIFNSSNSNTRTFTLGASSITMTGAGGSQLPWNTLTTTNFTFNANTSTITFNAANANLASGALTFNNVVFTTIATSCVINSQASGLTFSNLTKTNGAVKTDQMTVGGTNGTFTVTGTLTLTGNSVTNRLWFASNTIGTARSITAAIVSLTNVDFRDITALGAASPWTGTSLGDCGGNTNITTDTPVTRYWVGNGGNWAGTTHWSTSSGGASGASEPLVHDTVVFDTNSITSASQTITFNQKRYPGVDFSNILYNPILATSVSGTEFYGNFILKSGLITSGANSWFMSGRTNATMTTNNVTLTMPWNFNSPPGVTITITDNLVVTNTITHNQGTITFQGNVQCTTFTSNNSNTRVINMGSGTWTLKGTGTVFNTSTVTNLTVNGSSASVNITDTSSTSKTFDGRAILILSMTITGGGTGFIQLPGSNFTVRTLIIGAPKTIHFAAGSTTNITKLIAIGNASNTITFDTQTAGSGGTLSKPLWGRVVCDYLSLKDSIATGGANWYAGTNSGTISNVSGWIFTAPPTNRAGLDVMRTKASGRSLATGRTKITNRVVIT